MRPRVEEKPLSLRTTWGGFSLTQQHTGLRQVYGLPSCMSVYVRPSVCLLNTPSLLGWFLRKKMQKEPTQSLGLGMTTQSWV